MLAAKGSVLDPVDPETCLEYFRIFYGIAVRDARGVEAERKEFNYSAVAEKFKLIEDQCTSPLVVNYGESEIRLAKLALPWQKREALRGLQRFTVQVYPMALRSLSSAGAVDEVYPGVHRLLLPFHHLYETEYGLNLRSRMLPDTASMII